MPQNTKSLKIIKRKMKAGMSRADALMSDWRSDKRFDRKRKQTKEERDKRFEGRGKSVGMKIDSPKTMTKKRGFDFITGESVNKKFIYKRKKKNSTTKDK